MALAAMLTACSDPGDLTISNESSTGVTVLVGDQVVKVPESGGTVLLDYGCTPGDVTVVTSGPAVVLPGPVCPDTQIMIRRDGTVELQPASAGST
ncbi:hypothetical protein [Pengzhenrongella phosphoraccumulans]|uniref:hypothetical protein n=1 Tax=Pengzhenrongella phosphoraccumulans TaxID=3114394 RepID=UPI00388F3135